MRLLWIAIAGAAGSLARYGVGMAALALGGRGWPIGTLVVNIAGCFGIGFVAAVAHRVEMNETLRLTLITGFLGGFTTYSAFNEELLSMLRGGSVWMAGGYLAATLIGAAIAGVAGYGVARALVAP